ncbi:MAG: glycosyltransferase family 39 protein [Acidimicrobiia bacterium]|nr:glycosyltransferase family 39 protein [Acidimicrobiia bacterium]
MIRVRRAWIPGLPDGLLIAAVAAVDVALGWLGWATRSPPYDSLVYVDAARALLDHGQVPAAGHLSSLASHFPPGGTYWFVPGVLLFDDPRLFESPTTALAQVVALVLLFGLVRDSFGTGAARLAVLLFGLSALGVMAWDGILIGHFYHPVLALAAVRCTALWVTRRRAWYVAAALAVISMAMYVQHPLMVLLLSGVAAAWYVYRPPVRVLPVAVVGLVSLVVWFPYLQFEWERGFADVRSMVTHTWILPADYASVWCDPTMRIEPLEVPVEPATRSSVDTILKVPAHAARAAGAFTSNVRLSGTAPGIPWLLLAAMLACPFLWRVNPAARTLCFSTFAPWLALTVLSEPGRPDRTLWLWALQVALVTGTIAWALQRVSRPAIRVAVAAIAVGLVAGNALVISGPLAWLETGWAGTLPDRLQAVSAVASEVRAEGRTHAAIGYDVSFWAFQAREHILDPAYKVGRELDAWLVKEGCATTLVARRGCRRRTSGGSCRSTPTLSNCRSATGSPGTSLPASSRGPPSVPT